MNYHRLGMAHTIFLESKIHDDVQRYGWHAVSISDIAPPFLYSVGLMKTFNHPEAIIFGLETQNASDKRSCRPLWDARRAKRRNWLSLRPINRTNLETSCKPIIVRTIRF